MSNLYRSVLESGGGVVPTGDAVAADVLTGKTFSNASAVGISGTMPNNGAVSGTASPSQPYTIPAGYHNGSGVVTAVGSGNPLLDLADDTYADVSLANGISVASITSGVAISIENRTVFGNIENFTTAATGGQGIGNNTRVSNDGVTWVSIAAGSGNVSGYKYFMAYSANAGVTITFT